MAEHELGIVLGYAGIVATIIVGGGVFGVQYWLNRKVNKLVKEVHAHIEQQGQIHESIRRNSFRYIRANLKSARDGIGRFVRSIDSLSSNTSNNKRLLFINDQIPRHRTNERLYIEQHLSIVRPYVDGNLSDRIESAANQIRIIYTPDRPGSDPIFRLGIPETFDTWYSRATETISFIDALLADIPDNNPSR